MVYIYAFLGRLLLYPYLALRAKYLLSPQYLGYFRRLLLIEFGLSTLSLLTHRFIMHPLMSMVMDANLYIFFSLGYVGAFIVALHILRRLLAYAGYSTRERFSPKTRQRIDRSVGLFSLLLFFGIMALGHHSGHTIKVVDYSAANPSHKPLLARVVLVTDLHIGEGGGIEHVKRVVAKVNSLKPDLILFGGDYIDHDPKYAYQADIMAEMRKLRARDGIFFTPGNHEYRVDTTASFKWVEEIGATLLLDSIVYPRDSAYSLIGRRDFVDEARKPLPTLLQNLKPKTYNLLLEHTPEDLDLLETAPLDYALYGHTHAGQLWPYTYVLYLKYRLPYGTEQIGHTRAIVSSGVGAAGTLFRIGTQSEIVLLNLYQK